MTNWANSLGLQYSAQPAYNLPLDMLALIPYVNAPETESLGFSNNIDGYRQFSGPADLAGKRVISSELGAEAIMAYQQTLPQLLFDVKRSLVGGINAFVLHGFAYSGQSQNPSSHIRLAKHFSRIGYCPDTTW